MNIIKKVKDQNGFAHILILPIAVVLVLGVAGVAVYKSTATAAPTSTTATGTGSSSPTTSQTSPTNTTVSFSVIASGPNDPTNQPLSFPYTPNPSDYPYGYRLDADKLTVILGYRETGGYSIEVKSVKLQRTSTSSTYIVTTQETIPGPNCPRTSNFTDPYQTVLLGRGSLSGVTTATLYADPPITKTC